jgi:ABC-2 type transport system ATP-binding protein/sodium transport system ATP-binding protein
MISLVELTKRFPTRNGAITAVDHLSLTVKPAEVFGLLGPNGAGKTTTLRMIIGLLPPDSGYAEVDGFRSSMQPDEVKARIGCVTANDGMYPWLTVRETLLFFADLYGIDPETAQARVEQLADLFDLRAYLDRRAGTLSTGQTQRAVLARGLVHNPPVMLLDEPTRGLDVVGTQVVFDFLSQLRSSKTAVVLSTHRLDEAQRVCDRFGLLHQGTLRYEGTLSALRDQTGRTDLIEMFRDLISGQPARG